ncbi:hypothetical protein C8J57DRAFT_1723948 [Mycena rebaudengoi]|nr:hypothetical protein C8J57DRAFT_1723948 [Mycena rebaudengoi]
MTATAIPVEVQERILDHLHAEISTLKTCSLVGRAWRPTSRIHLFRKFRVSYDCTSSDDAAFDYCSRFEEQALHLAEYVREIYVEDAFATMLGGIMSESHAFARILDRTSTLHRLSISAYCRRHGSTKSILRKSSLSCTHLFLDGFFFAHAEILDIFRGMRQLEYVGMERSTLLLQTESQLQVKQSLAEQVYAGRLRTFTVYCPFDNGRFVTSTVSALDGVDTSRINHLRLCGDIGVSILLALPPSWLRNVTHLSLQLLVTGLNPNGPLSAASTSIVPKFVAMRDLELSLVFPPFKVPFDLSPLAIVLLELFPDHRLNSIVTTVVTARPIYFSAIDRHFEFCLVHSERVKLLWRDGKEEEIFAAFPELFMSGVMEISPRTSDIWMWLPNPVLVPCPHYHSVPTPPSRIVGRNFHNDMYHPIMFWFNVWKTFQTNGPTRNIILASSMRYIPCLQSHPALSTNTPSLQVFGPLIPKSNQPLSISYPPPP